MYWSPDFLAVVFKKQEISRLKAPSACCLLGYTRPREPTNKHCSHENAWFSIWVFKKFSGVITRTLTAEGGDPLPHPTPSRPLAERGVQAPRCWDPNLGPPHLFRRGCAPVRDSIISRIDTWQKWCRRHWIVPLRVNTIFWFIMSCLNALFQMAWCEGRWRPDSSRNHRWRDADACQ